MSLEKVKAVKVKLQCRNELDKPTRYLTVVLKHDKYKIRGLHGDSDDSCVGCSDLSWTATIGLESSPTSQILSPTDIVSNIRHQHRCSSGRFTETETPP